jgi:hypothetical protein
MADKKMKRIVAHPKLYLRVDGKLQLLPKGTEITVTKEQCEALGKKLMDPAEQKKLDATTKGSKLTEGGEAESAAVTKLTADLGAANEALVKTATDLESAKAEVKALKAAAKK